MFKAIKKFFKKLLDGIKKLFNKLMDFLGPLLPILVIALFLFAGPIGTALTGMLPAVVISSLELIAGWGFWVQLGAGVVTSMVMAPTETAAIVHDVAEAAGDVVTEVGEGVGDAAGSVVGGLLTSVTDSGVMPWLIAGVVAYFILTSSNDEDPVQEQKELTT